MLYSEDDIRFIREEEDGDDVILTFETSNKVVGLLKEAYGDNFEEEFSKEFSNYLKEFVNGQR